VDSRKTRTAHIWREPAKDALELSGHVEDKRVKYYARALERADGGTRPRSASVTRSRRLFHLPSSFNLKHFTSAPRLPSHLDCRAEMDLEARSRDTQERTFCKWQVATPPTPRSLHA
jgi:hypothetical protein